MLISRVEDTNFYSKNSIRIGENLLDLSSPKIMGIINCTPDSFYEKSTFANSTDILKQVEKNLIDGASIIDIGGQSSRPGADLVSEAEEIKRTATFISEIKKEFPASIISIDTFRGNVAEQAILSGADIINDISGFNFDNQMIKAIEKYKKPYILTHSKGSVKTMQDLTNYTQIFKEIAYYFSEKISQLKEIGVNDIILDAGFGFAKNLEQNHYLLKNLDAFHFFQLPLLVGISRKSMIYKKLEIEANEALNGTTTLNTLAILKGAKILRVHDVKEANEILKLLA
jgi:dihydropteroate synthase